MVVGVICEMKKRSSAQSGMTWRFKNHSSQWKVRIQDRDPSNQGDKSCSRVSSRKNPKHLFSLSEVTCMLCAGAYPLHITTPQQEVICDY